MGCMFCKPEKNLTREHVFPAFMGGELTVPDGSCQGCNGEFGKWEGTIRESTKFLLNLLQIENRKGEVPTVRVEVEIRGMDVKGLFGTREADGTISFSDVVIPSVKPDGKKHREGFFISKESAEKFVERSRARGEKTTELQVPKEIIFDATYTQRLPFVFTLEARKVAAKIALTSIAYKYGVPYALSAQFDALRNVRTAATEKEMPLRVFCSKTFMAAHIPCELGITIATEHALQQPPSGKGSKADRLLNDISGSLLLQPCAQMENPSENPNQFQDPQLLLTGVRMARDSALRKDYPLGDISRSNALYALYKLSRPAAFVVSMHLLIELRIHHIGKSPGVSGAARSYAFLRDNALAVAFEANQLTDQRSEEAPAVWLKAHQNLSDVWMEDDLQKLRTNPSLIDLTSRASKHN